MGEDGINGATTVGGKRGDGSGGGPLGGAGRLTATAGRRI